MIIYIYIYSGIGSRSERVDWLCSSQVLFFSDGGMRLLIYTMMARDYVVVLGEGRLIEI